MKDPFNKNRYNATDAAMTVGDFVCSLNMPKAIKNTNTVNGLPPYNPRPAFKVDEYPATPESWMHGSTRAGSYFVPVMSEHGMWLDLNGNSQHEHDVAVVISLQGVNALTGQKSDPIRLEQYKTACPVHKKDFKQDRFCEDCGHKWPSQNYLATTGTPWGRLWLDGFMTKDGEVRQFFFTEETAKGVAAQIIGDERVYAIGIAFYKSKKPKPRPTVTVTPLSYPYPTSWVYGTTITNVGCTGIAGPTGVQGSTGPIGFSGKAPTSWKKGRTGSKGRGRRLGSRVTTRRTRGTTKGVVETTLTNHVSTNLPPVEAQLNSINCVNADAQAMYSASVDSGIEACADIESMQKILEIGAGAKISQRVYEDPQSLDYWEEEPAGFIYINYCDVETVQAILAAGPRKEKSDGFLSGLNLKD